MNRKLRNSIYVLLSIGFLILSFWGYKEYQRPASTEVSHIESAENMDIDELIAFFQRNELQANATYVNKVIEVSGVIKDISLLNDRYTVFLKSETFSKNFVMCDMSPSGKIQGDQLTIGDSITLKGVCKGYLLDVIMLNCIPIDEKPKK